jgi:hypothetical protein
MAAERQTTWRGDVIEELGMDDQVFLEKLEKSSKSQIKSPGID